MDDVVVRTRVSCNTEKRIEIFYKNFPECRACNIKRFLKRYYNKKDEILQQRRDKYPRFKDMDKRPKALEEKLIF